MMDEGSTEIADAISRVLEREEPGQILTDFIVVFAHVNPNEDETRYGMASSAMSPHAARGLLVIADEITPEIL